MRLSNEVRRNDGDHLSKKRAGRQPCSKNCVDPVCPANLDLKLVDGMTLLFLRVGAPPETWTTKRRPCGLPAIKFVDEFFDLVINFGNECSKFEQFAKSLRKKRFRAHFVCSKPRRAREHGETLNFLCHA
jgi:hypothetical protein